MAKLLVIVFPRRIGSEAIVSGQLVTLQVWPALLYDSAGYGEGLPN